MATVVPPLSPCLPSGSLPNKSLPFFWSSLWFGNRYFQVVQGEGRVLKAEHRHIVPSLKLFCAMKESAGSFLWFKEREGQEPDRCPSVTVTQLLKVHLPCQLYPSDQHPDLQIQTNILMLWATGKYDVTFVPTSLCLQLPMVMGYRTLSNSLAQDLAYSSLFPWKAAEDLSTTSHVHSLVVVNMHVLTPYPH